MNKTVEVTLEANPGTVDEPYLAAVRQLGVNRLSLGVQSMDNETLMLLGRTHTAVQASQSVQFARDSGFTNLSLDLMYGIPGQSLATWQDTLKEAVQLEPEHLSLYPLSLEDDVPLNRVIRRGQIPPIDPDRTAEQYEAAEDYLASEGYVHYEISNWAREGFQRRHNMVYWQCLPYLGIGVAAHSYIDGHRRANTHDLDEYIRMFQPGAFYRPETDEEIKPETQLAEAIIMGLRLNRGIKFADMRDRFGIELVSRYGQEMDELTQLGLIETNDQSIRLTRRGRLLGVAQFVTGDTFHVPPNTQISFRLRRGGVVGPWQATQFSAGDQVWQLEFATVQIGLCESDTTLQVEVSGVGTFGNGEVMHVPPGSNISYRLRRGSCVGPWNATQFSAGDTTWDIIDDCANLPSIEIIKTASPDWIDNPGGGEATFTFTINNLSASNTVTINSLTDSVFGDLNSQGDCACPQIIPAGGSYSCSMTTEVTRNLPDAHTNIVTACGIDDNGIPVIASDDVYIDIGD